MKRLEEWLARNLEVAKTMPLEDVLRQTIWAGYTEGISFASKNFDCTVYPTDDLQPREIEKPKDIQPIPVEYRLYQYQTDCMSQPELPKKGQWVIQKKIRSGYWRNVSIPFHTQEEADAYLQERIVQDSTRS